MKLLGASFTILGIDLRLAEPERLPWAIAILLALVALLYGLRKSRRALESLSSSPALRRLLVSDVSRARPLLKGALAVFSMSLFFIALLRPQIGEREVAVERRGIDVVVAVDASRSMHARDILPSRLARAKLELSSLIDRLAGDRVGLVAFAGEAFVQCPLTHDYAAAKLFLRAIDPEAMPSQGTAIASALRTAETMFEAAEDGAKSRAILLLSDGEDHSGEVEAAGRSLAEKGIRVYALGVGTPAGSPIPILDAEGEVVSYRRDRHGETVISRLEDAQLRALAERTGGRYFSAGSGDLGMAAIAAELSRLEKTEREGHVAREWGEAYHFFLAPGLLLLALSAAIGERRRPR